MSLANRFLGSPWALEAVWEEVEQSKPVREKSPSRADLPLSDVTKHVMALAAEEADKLSIKRIGTGHLLLGLLREEKCLAAEILRRRGVRLAATREELARTPHDDSVIKEFVRERGSLPDDVVEVQTHIRSIASRMKDAIAGHDFAKAQAHANEERVARDKLYMLCQQHRLSDWLYE